MNTIIKSMAIVCLVTSTALANPLSAAVKSADHNAKFNHSIFSDKEAFSINIQPMSNSSIVYVLVEKTQGKDLSVTLKDPSGVPVYTYRMSKKAVKANQSYNFENAEQGTYTLVVSYGNKKITKEISLQRTRAAEVTELAVK